MGEVAPAIRPCVTQSLNSGWDGHEIQNCDVLPERQGEVCDKSITLSDQEGAVSSASLRAVIVDQSLGHQPALFHATVKPWL